MQLTLELLLRPTWANSRDSIKTRMNTASKSRISMSSKKKRVCLVSTKERAEALSKCYRLISKIFRSISSKTLETSKLTTKETRWKKEQLRCKVSQRLQSSRASCDKNSRATSNKPRLTSRSMQLLGSKSSVKHSNWPTREVFKDVPQTSLTKNHRIPTNLSLFCNGHQTWSITSAWHLWTIPTRSYLTARWRVSNRQLRKTDATKTSQPLILSLRSR